MAKFLIVGLGNPGQEYTYTRHNIGFRIIDNWLSNLSLTTPNCDCDLKLNKKFNSELSKIINNDNKIFLMKPQTFMNKSGVVVRQLLDYQNIFLENILIIHDDLSFPIGKFKLSKNVGPAGHNGVKSIIENLGTKNFSRLRIGIASIDNSCPINHQSGHTFVLNKFSQKEENIIDKLFKITPQILDYFINNGFALTANKFNNDTDKFHH